MDRQALRAAASELRESTKPYRLQSEFMTAAVKVGLLLADYADEIAGTGPQQETIDWVPVLTKLPPDDARDVFICLRHETQDVKLIWCVNWQQWDGNRAPVDFRLTHWAAMPRGPR